MSQFDLKKFLVENKLTSNSRKLSELQFRGGKSLVGGQTYAPEHDPYDGPDAIDRFMDAASDSDIFNQSLINDIQALLDRADSNGRLDLSAANPEDEIVRVLVDIWGSGRLPHTISDYVHPTVLIRDYGFTQQELDDDRAEYNDLHGYQPLDEGETYDYPIDRHDRDYTAEDIAHLARKYGLSMQEMYELVQDYGVDGVISNYEDDLNEEETYDYPIDRHDRDYTAEDIAYLAHQYGLSMQEMYELVQQYGVDGVIDAYDEITRDHELDNRIQERVNRRQKKR